MIVTDVKTYVVGNPWKNWVFIELLTDEGLVGHGEATGGLSTMPNAAEVDEVKPLVVGRDPMNVQGLWDHLQKSLYFRSSNALSGIEMACWDLIGQKLGVPVWQLLGGAVRPRLRAYANGWYSGPRDPKGFAETARAVVDTGYTALKFDPFGTAFKTLSAAELRESLALVAAVREAVGDDVDLMIEAHDRFTVPEAVRIGRELERFRPLWLEAPVLSTDIPSVLEVARSQPVRVAAGERLSSIVDFHELLHPRVVDIVQPEILQCGGVRGLLDVAAAAQAYGAWIAPHNAQSPFTTIVNAHVAAASPSFLIQETFDDFLEPWSRDILSRTCSIRDGYIDLPQGPGFGVEFVHDEFARHPYSPQNFLRLFSPGWEKRNGDRN